MSTLLTVGVAHHDAPLAQLERCTVTRAVRAEVQAAALDAGCAEIMVLSTCSRIELHAVVDVPPAGGDLPPDAQADLAACGKVADRLAALLLGAAEARAGDAAVAVGEDAVHHVFRVAAGLDSRIVGEVEVQAQLRAAARAAKAAHGEPHRLRRVVSAAVAAARQTSAEQPGLLRRGLLSERAVARALAPFDGAEAVGVLVVGAGTMGRQVVASLPADRCRVTLLSRTSTAPAGGPAVLPLEELPSRLHSADVLFVATSAGRRILPAELVREVLATRPGRPLTLVDLSLPRNVDPAVVAVPGVRLLDLDALGDRACGAVPDRRAVGALEAATAAAAERHCAEVRSRRAGPVVTALRARVEEVCLHQLRRTTRGLTLSDEELTRMASAVAGAVAHGPTVLARTAAADGDAAALDLLASAFGVETPSAVDR
jgi:glutamyl-tRNA reductase